MVAKMEYENQQYWTELFDFMNRFHEDICFFHRYKNQVTDEIIDKVFSDSVDYILESMETYHPQDFEILTEGYLSDVFVLNDEAELHLLDPQRREYLVEFIFTISNLCGFGDATDYKSLFRRI